MKFSHLLIGCVMAASAMSCVGVGQDDTPQFDRSHIMALARETLSGAEREHYSDQWLMGAIAGDSCSLWVGPHGVYDSADTLLAYLSKVSDEGLSPEFFRVADLRERVDSARSWVLNGRRQLLTDSLLAEIEAGLTLSYLRYSYGQSFGYVRPRKVFNHLLADVDAPQGEKRPYRQLTDIPYEVPTDSLAAVAINSLRRGEVGDFLRSIQPDSHRHQALINEYRRASRSGDAKRARKAAVNLERNRWRYPRPASGRYIMVNLAARKLWAVDTDRDTCLESRVCIGNQAHKSPMLMSRVSRVELNPYWNVPMSIIRNEVVKSHLHDSAYFARNNMFAINHDSGERVDPTGLSADQWRSGRYALRQDKGKGNSLGRMVFRFPNIFSVYLHDTNNPGAFRGDTRTVSHGCIRVEKPLDLALFLLGDEASPMYVDRIRLSIDLPPLTPAGRELQAKEPEPLRECRFKESVPLWIDYITMYPAPDGSISEYPDIYSYDEAIAEAMGRILRP